MVLCWHRKRLGPLSSRPFDWQTIEGNNWHGGSVDLVLFVVLTVERRDRIRRATRGVRPDETVPEYAVSSLYHGTIRRKFAVGFANVQASGC